MMYRDRDRDKTVSRVQSLWSVLKYDLATAIDVLGLPSLVRLSDNDVTAIFNDVTPTNGISGGYRVKFERKVSFYSVRARVCELQDIDWFTWCKGEEFVAQHRRLVGTEFFVPVDYKGKIRLAERTQDREYFSITEVIKDFPRFVRVERDTACFSPGDINYHVVHKGAVLELDRVTQNNRSAGRSRDNFLICFDRNDGREIAFRVMSPVHFRKVHDNTKYKINEFIELLPLPRKVEFINVNPYDIIVADDETANDILVMLSGPVELLELTRSEYLIGRMPHPITGEMNILALPMDNETLESFLVYIPSTFIIETEKDYANTVIPGHTDCDLLQQKLYTNSVDVTSPLLLKCDMSPFCFYDTTDPPDTPPLPPKYDFATLKSTLSEQHVASDESSDDKMESCRRRFLSTGDLKGTRSRSSLRSVDRESRGIKGYLSHLSHRFKSSASQLFFGIDSQPNPSFRGSLRSHSPGRISIRSLMSKRQSPPTETSFVCYLNCSNDDEFQMSNAHDTSSEAHERAANKKLGYSTDREAPNHVDENSANHLPTKSTKDSLSNQTDYTTANRSPTNSAHDSLPNQIGCDSANRCSTNSETNNPPNQIDINTANCVSTNSASDSLLNELSESPSLKGATSKESTFIFSEEVIYATVQKMAEKPNSKPGKTKKVFLCQVCRENLEQSSLPEH